MDHSNETVRERGLSQRDDNGNVPDGRLATQAGRGDAAAWELLMRRYQEPAFRLAYLLLGDAADAEDVTQDAFIRAYLHLDQYDQTRPLRPWLLTIVANLARNRRRSLGRYLAALRQLFATTPHALDVSYSDGVQDQWEARRLHEAVRRLNRSGQEIVYCRYFLALSEAETAEILAIAPGTVKSRTHRALKQLRTVIEQDFPSLHAEWLG